tara:strand:- start:230 stop:505 length:276 start_codon:yes stop_codon:yes gene_type:complete
MRTLYIACYDIRDPKRLREGLLILKEFAQGGQYSCFECFLNTAERQELLMRMQCMMHMEDCFLLMPLVSGRPVATLGVGVAPKDNDFYLIG